MPPPYKKGGMDSRSVCGAHNTPTPKRENILWPEKTKKSQPKSATFGTPCTIACAPSMTTTAPTWCASAVNSCAGFTAPVALTTAEKDTILVHARIFFCASCISKFPSASGYSHCIVAPVQRHTCCHGTIFA